MMGACSTGLSNPGIATCMPKSTVPNKECGTWLLQLFYLALNVAHRYFIGSVWQFVWCKRQHRHRFGTGCLLHVKILSSAHLQRRDLGQDAKNWQDLWGVLEGSIQHKTSECCRGTFYFNINLNIYQLKFLSKHGAAKVQGPEVVVQTPFEHLCAITHHNLSLCPNTLMEA